MLVLTKDPEPMVKNPLNYSVFILSVSDHYQSKKFSGVVTEKCIIKNMPYVKYLFRSSPPPFEIRSSPSEHRYGGVNFLKFITRPKEFECIFPWFKCIFQNTTFTHPNNTWWVLLPPWEAVLQRWWQSWWRLQPRSPAFGSPGSSSWPPGAQPPIL